MWLGTCCPWKCKRVARMGCQKNNDMMKDTGTKMIKNVSIPVFRIWLAPMERSKLLNHVEPFISHEMCLCIRSKNNDWWKDTRLHLLSLTPGSSATHKRAGSDKWDRLLSRQKKVKAAVVELLHVQYMCLLAVILSEERCVVSARRPGWWSVLNVEKMMQR